jgi:PGF-CTERM protein
VVDGTVYVGSEDNNLYAVDADVEGSSEGSRVTLRTLGHHNAGADKQQFDADSTDTPTEDDGTSSDDQPESGGTDPTEDDASAQDTTSSGTGPGLGVGSAIAALTSAGYALHRRREQ